MRIIIVGSNLQAQLLIKTLTSAHNKITLISDNLPFCTQIADQYDHDVVHGDASKHEILAAAGASRTDLLISLTGQDADNLIICELAKKIFKIPRTISIVENPMNCSVFQHLGVDDVICAAEACTKMVENAVVMSAG